MKIGRENSRKTPRFVVWIIGMMMVPFAGTGDAGRIVGKDWGQR